MKMHHKTSRLLVTFIVLAAFLFGHAAALEHVGQHGAGVHSLASHAGDSGATADRKGHDHGHQDGLCDLSVYGAGLAVTLVDSVSICVPVSFIQTAFVPTHTALLGGVFTTGPPVRGPPHLS